MLHDYGIRIYEGNQQAWIEVISVDREHEKFVFDLEIRDTVYEDYVDWWNVTSMRITFFDDQIFQRINQQF